MGWLWPEGHSLLLHVLYRWCLSENGKALLKVLARVMPTHSLQGTLDSRSGAMAEEARET